MLLIIYNRETLELLRIIPDATEPTEEMVADYAPDSYGFTISEHTFEEYLAFGVGHRLFVEDGTVKFEIVQTDAVTYENSETEEQKEIANLKSEVATLTEMLGDLILGGAV
ncbi:hypothetical protein ACFSL6_25005 [Paenibacillus thailandensis]|uniref:Uncharacterized protein n=1 Tax=Paenibacillus thailandensis TaxID=393250 RepID=A0ABW5R3K3_9BACL